MKSLRAKRLAGSGAVLKEKELSGSAFSQTASCTQLTLVDEPSHIDDQTISYRLTRDHGQ
eukprot:6182790-Pleurochrysis_carterae.AAC.2